MADNTILNSGSGGDTIATDDISGVKFPRGKITLGADGTNDGDVSKANPLPIGGNTVKDGSGTVYAFLVDADAHLQIDVLSCASHAVTNAGTFVVQINGDALTSLQLIDDAVYTDGTGTPSKGIAVMGTDGTNPQLLSVTSGGHLHIHDGGNTITVDGTVAATQSGTWNVTNISGTVSLPTGASTLAEQQSQTTHLATIAGDTTDIETAVELIDDAIVADDAAFTPGTTKVMMAGYEFDDSSPDTVNEGDAGAARMSSRREVYIQLRDAAGNERGANVDASGQLAVAGPVTNAGTFVVQINGTALTRLTDIETNTDFGATTGGGAESGALRVTIASDSTGVLSVDDNGSTLSIDDGGSSITVDGTVAVSSIGTSVTPGTSAAHLGKAEDAAHASGDTGVFMLAVRSDTAAATGQTDGDYTALVTDSSGRLHVNVGNTVTVGSHAVTNAGTFAVQSTLQAGTAYAGKVRLTDGTTDTDVRDLGNSNALNVAIVDGSGDQITSFGGGTQYTEDAVVPANPVGNALLAERDDALGGLTPAQGDWTHLFTSANGALWVTIDGTVTVASHAVTNAGTFVVQENGAALTALQLIDDTIFADDAAFTIGTSKVSMVGATVDESSTDSADEGDAVAIRATANRQLVTTVRPNASGEGLDIFRSLDLDETEEEIKGSAGKLYGYYFYNSNASARFLKFYNATAANVTVGSTTPVLTLGLPATSAGHVEFTNGIPFSTAMTAAATTGVADADTGAPSANDVVVNVFYK